MHTKTQLAFEQYWKRLQEYFPKIAEKISSDEILFESLKVAHSQGWYDALCEISNTGQKNA